MPIGVPGKVTIICPGCNKKREHKARGLCSKCYKRPKIVCVDCGKEKEHKAKGRCARCYRRPKIICADCGRQEGHAAKGLCNSCYKRQHYKAHKERFKTYSRCYRWEHRKEIKIYNHNYYVEHKEQLRERRRKHYQQNKEAYLNSAKKWRQANPERSNALSLASYYRNREKILATKRHSRLQGLPNSPSKAQIRQIITTGKATYPGAKLEIDHVVPVSRGGLTTLGNLHAIPICLNRAKRDKLPEVAYKQLMFYS